MGVTHSMDDAQVHRISRALSESATAIQGINTKFDVIDEHVREVQEFNTKLSAKIQDAVDKVEALDSTVNERLELVMGSVKAASDQFSMALEGSVCALQNIDLRREMDQVPKIIMPFTIPIIILLIELAIANAYLGILLSSVMTVRTRYGTYLLANASAVLLGLTVSLLWLVIYRSYLSWKTRTKQMMEAKDQQDWSSEDLSVSSGCVSSVGGSDSAALARMSQLSHAERLQRLAQGKKMQEDRFVRSLTCETIEAELDRRRRGAFSASSSSRELWSRQTSFDDGPRWPTIEKQEVNGGELAPGGEAPQHGSTPAQKQHDGAAAEPEVAEPPSGARWGRGPGDCREDDAGGEQRLRQREGPHLSWRNPFTTEVVWSGTRSRGKNALQEAGAVSAGQAHESSSRLPCASEKALGQM